MANLNFHTPQRSIANTSLTGRSTSGFAGGSMSGHVTPTGNMFQTGTPNYGQAQQPQLSPNRNPQLNMSGSSLSGAASRLASTNIFNTRALDRRAVHTGLGGSAMPTHVGMMQQQPRLPGYGSSGGGGGSIGAGAGSAMNNFHNVFGGNGDTATPPLLDPSEFPSLTSGRGQNDQTLPQSNSQLHAPGNKPYGNFFSFGMVKQPTAEQSEFTMSKEDFPALPGTQNNDGTTNASNNMPENNVDNLDKQMNAVVGSGSGGVGSGNAGNSNAAHVGQSVGQVGGGSGPGGGGGSGAGAHNNTSASSGMSNMGGFMSYANENSSNDKNAVQTSPDGKVTNIPASMLDNQYGIVGLLTFLRATEGNRNLVSLAMGTDLTGLGLNLNSAHSIYSSFGGPFSETPCRAQDIEHEVPSEYLVNAMIRDKLDEPNLKKCHEDLLFYLFYTNPGDMLQLMAAAELYSRDWRYHMEEKHWITKAPGYNNTYDKNGSKEHGHFVYFDAISWKRVTKVFQIDTDKFEKCPNLSAYVNGQSV